MTYNPEEAKEKIIKKFELISNQYHKLSLLFYELSQSLRIESKNKSYKEFKQYIKSLNLDINKIIKLSNAVANISLNDIKKKETKNDG